MWHKNVSRFDNNRFVITDTYCITYECSNGVCEHVRLWRQNGSRFFSSRTESIFLFIVTLVADTSGNDKAFTCCVWSVTLSKSNGCVKHAAPPLANPPKYHRDCRVCATFDDISSLLLSVSRSQSSLRKNNCKRNQADLNVQAWNPLEIWTMCVCVCLGSHSHDSRKFSPRNFERYFLSMKR